MGSFEVALFCRFERAGSIFGRDIRDKLSDLRYVSDCR
jgi:hypothetical protein